MDRTAPKGEKPGSLDALLADNDRLAKERAAQPEAIREFEAACNTIALIFPSNSPQRRIALQARGDMREANGEERS